MITDQWRTWQQGGCLEYALALISERPTLRFGSLEDDEGTVVHHFAHDDTYAYDSAGRHPLPYRGIDGDLTPLLDDFPTDYDEPDPELLPDAVAHIRRNRTLDTPANP